MVRVRRMVTASRAASRTGAALPSTSASSSPSGPGSARASKTASSWRPNSSGRTRLTTTADSCTVVSSRTRSASSMVSSTGISSGVQTATSPVLRRIGEDVEHPVGLGADEAYLDQIVDGLGGGQLPDDVSRGRGVHHHHVIVPLPHLVAELAHGEDLPDPGRRRGHEVERLGQRTDAARPPGSCSWSFRYSRSDASVSMVMAKRPGRTSFSLKPVGGAS